MLHYMEPFSKACESSPSTHNKMRRIGEQSREGKRVYVKKKKIRGALSGRSLKSDLDFVITSDVIRRRF